MVVQIDDRVQVELMVNSAYGIAAFRSSHPWLTLTAHVAPPPSGQYDDSLTGVTGIPSEVI